MYRSNSLRTGLLAGASIALSIGMAYAGDLNTGGFKDAPLYAPGVNWTGFYIGVGGGGGATSSDVKGEADIDKLAAFADANGLGGMGGFGTVQVGYDREIDRRFVIGAFFDYDFASIDSKLSAGLSYKGSSIASIGAPFNLTDSWTVGGRAGYLVNPSTLVYGLAGYTEASFDLPQGAHDGTFSGWTAGAGIETNLSGPWFLKGEYRFTDLDQQTIYAGTAGCIKYKVTDQPEIQTGRLVLTYKLNAPGFDPLK